MSMKQNRDYSGVVLKKRLRVIPGCEECVVPLPAGTSFVSVFEKGLFTGRSYSISDGEITTSA